MLLPKLIVSNIRHQHNGPFPTLPVFSLAKTTEMTVNQKYIIQKYFVVFEKLINPFCILIDDMKKLNLNFIKIIKK